MIRTYYHGTSADNLKSILKHGLGANENKLWNVSEDIIYLWCPEAVAKDNDIEEDEDKKLEAFRRASESAQYACAVAKDCRLVVIEIELDEDEIQPDKSSENMEGQGAVCIYRDILPHEIRRISISNDLSLLKGYWMHLASINEFSNIELSRAEQRIVKAFAKLEIYPEETEDMIQWKEVKIKQHA